MKRRFVVGENGNNTVGAAGAERSGLEYHPRPNLTWTLIIAPTKGAAPKGLRCGIGRDFRVGLEFEWRLLDQFLQIVAPRAANQFHMLWRAPLGNAAVNQSKRADGTRDQRSPAAN